jgi:hypothetical protein
MEFLSIRFLVLFSVSFLIYCLVGKRFRNSLLLLASFVFIGWLYPPFLITAVAVALFTFFWAQLLERKPTQLVYVSGIALLVFSLDRTALYGNRGRCRSSVRSGCEQGKRHAQSGVSARNVVLYLPGHRLSDRRLLAG